MPSFPIHDWQFWVATAAFLGAAVWLLKGVVPIPFLSKRHKRRKSHRRVSLTVEGRAAEKK